MKSVFFILTILLVVACNTKPETRAKVIVQEFNVTRSGDWYTVSGLCVNSGEKVVRDVTLRINDWCMMKEIKGGEEFYPGESENFRLQCHTATECCHPPFTWEVTWSE